VLPVALFFIGRNLVKPEPPYTMPNPIKKPFLYQKNTRNAQVLGGVDFLAGVAGKKI
jgi:hypothetical protein